MKDYSAARSGWELVTVRLSPQESRVDSEYARYLEYEWNSFSRELSRSEESLHAAAGPVARVLDVGCGGGQELVPFIAMGAVGVGVDRKLDAAHLGRQLWQRAGYPDRPRFLCATAEHLPFDNGVFDVVISRVALPYTDNRPAISEMARVLRPGGTILLKIHHGRYYLQKFWKGLRTGYLLSSVHAARVLTSGVIYHVTGRQLRNRLVTGETFMTRWLLDRELARQGLTIERELRDSNPHTPSFVIRKAQVSA